MADSDECIIHGDLKLVAPKVPTRQLAEVSRQELYDLIWSTPASKLSADFGISDVAIAKRCKKLNIPRPARGYWAKLEAGRKVSKAPLPATPEEVFEKAVEKPVSKSLRLPGKGDELHPLAVELMRALNATKPDSRKLASVRAVTLPEVEVTKALSEKVAQTFHVILMGVEPIGIMFRKALGRYDPGYFKKGNDRLYLRIEEDFIDKAGKRSGSRGHYASSYSDYYSLSGLLRFSLYTEQYGLRDVKQWAEDEKGPLGEVLADVVRAIRNHYLEVQKRRAQEAIDREKQRVESERLWREHQEQEAIREQEERKAKHAKRIEKIIRNRRDDLLKAAEWWRLHQVAREFLAECEARWRNERAGEIDSQQQEWLEWARKTVDALSPFEAGYPDPTKDGAFSPLSIPLGGPYPETREFSRPPTMPEIPAPVVVQQQGYSSNPPPPPQPYPFWLKYQRR